MKIMMMSLRCHCRPSSVFLSTRRLAFSLSSVFLILRTTSLSDRLLLFLLFLFLRLPLSLRLPCLLLLLFEQLLHPINFFLLTRRWRILVVVVALSFFCVFGFVVYDKTCWLDLKQIGTKPYSYGERYPFRCHTSNCNCFHKRNYKTPIIQFIVINMI